MHFGTWIHSSSGEGLDALQVAGVVARFAWRVGIGIRSIVPANELVQAQNR